MPAAFAVAVVMGAPSSGPLLLVALVAGLLGVWARPRRG